MGQQAVRQLGHGKHEYQVKEQLDHADLATLMPAAFAQQGFSQFHKTSFFIHRWPCWQQAGRPGASGARCRHLTANSGDAKVFGLTSLLLRSYLTGVGKGKPAKCACRLSTTSWPMAWRVSTVRLPTCGVSTTLAKALKAAGTRGSSLNTSSPAAPRRPSCKAEMSAASSTSAPRAILIKVPCRPSASSTAWSTALWVAGVPGALTIR